MPTGPDCCAAFRTVQAKWESDMDSLTAAELGEITRLYEGLIDGMVERAWKDGRAVYATFNAAVDIEKRYKAAKDKTFLAAPEGLAFRLLPEKLAVDLPPLEFRNRWEREPNDPVARLVRRRYARLWVKRGLFYEASGKWDLAVEAYRRADAIPPGSEAAAEALERLGAR